MIFSGPGHRLSLIYLRADCGRGRKATGAVEASAVEVGVEVGAVGASVSEAGVAEVSAPEDTAFRY